MTAGIAAWQPGPKRTTLVRLAINAIPRKLNSTIAITLNTIFAMSDLQQRSFPALRFEQNGNVIGDFNMIDASTALAIERDKGEFMVASTRNDILIGVFIGLAWAAVSAEDRVPDWSSNGVGWIAIHRDSVAVFDSPRPRE
jgi:hypothetical protein